MRKLRCWFYDGLADRFQDGRRQSDPDELVVMPLDVLVH